MWTERKGLLVMLQSPRGQAPVDHELGALPLDWVEPKPLPKILLSKKKRAREHCRRIILEDSREGRFSIVEVLREKSKEIMRRHLFQYIFLEKYRERAS